MNRPPMYRAPHPTVLPKYPFPTCTPRNPWRSKGLHTGEPVNREIQAKLGPRVLVQRASVTGCKTHEKTPLCRRRGSEIKMRAAGEQRAVRGVCLHAAHFGAPELRS